jgi:uncharacterized membrane protein
MDLRLALYELAARHELDAARVKRLRHLAGIDDEPASLSVWLPRGVAILAAALGGFGLILWIAANWETFGRFGRFALLQGLIAAACVGALAKPRARAPLGLIALLGIGGLFAYFGQTYPSGADPWQLFALWAALALPLCLGVRSDVLWAPWALVAMTGISLWTYAHLDHRWDVSPDTLSVHLQAWCAALLLVAALSAPARRFTGAGEWSLRLALTLTVAMFTSTALGGLFSNEATAHYALSLALLAVAAGMLSSAKFFDIFGLSAIALGLNILLISGLGKLLFNVHSSDFIGPLLLIGLAAAGLLAATVALILHLSRRHASGVAA